MKDFGNAPERATETSVSQNDGGMPYGNTSSGWRKATASLAVAEQYADEGERISVAKSKAFVAAKRVGVHLGLKASDLMLLDALGAFTQAQDWEEGRRPIVWVSNAFLMEQTGFSLSALKRHARRLVESGLISFKDSPNGKRWGHRDEDGVIIEAYGFDLSPLAARAGEFEVLYGELKAEREHCQRLKRQITVARRMIRARIEAAFAVGLNGPWARLRDTFEELLARLPGRKAVSETLESLLAWLRELQERVETAFLRANGAAVTENNAVSETGYTSKEIQKSNPRVANFEPHILTTKQLSPVTSNSLEKKEASDALQDVPADEQSGNGLDEWVTRAREKRGAALDLPTVMQACPEFASWAHNMGGYLKDWGDLYRIVGQLRPMIGVSEHAWHAAQDQLGKQIATAALVLVFDKHCAGEVTSPGGYLRGMVEKARAGELHLERSYFGRLNGKAA